MIGTSLTQYRITAKLGEGGMGEVYRATDTKLGRDVAIKVLPASFSRDPQSLARFEREAKALASLNHPHIAGIYGFDANQGTHFLVLELVEGETLAERLRRGPLPLNEALTVARQIAEALQEAHEKGIIHRDLKPGNVKLTPNGRVKVLDFGLAKMSQREGEAPAEPKPSHAKGSQVSAGASPSPQVDADAPTLQADTTRPGAVMGTPAYMSPEQARGQEVDKRTDVWAFGCCLFECLSGRKPFQGKTASDLMAEVLKSDPDWSRIPAETPPAVATLLRRCLEKESARRLSSLGDIALTLDESTRGPSTSSSTQVQQPYSSPNSASPAPSAGSAKWPWPVVLGLLMLTIGAGLFFWKRAGGERTSPVAPGAGSTKAPLSAASPVAAAVDAKSVAVLPFVNMSSDKENEYLSDGITEDLCTALAQVRGLRVPARTSCFVFKGKTEDIQKIGQQLHVAHVLEGSVSPLGKKLRVTAQLISVADGFHLWATNYDRDMNDLLALRSEIAQQVVAALRVQLLPGEKQRLEKKGTDNPEAHRLYLLGLSLWNQRTAESLKKALDYFGQALVKDPNYALAYVGLADCYACLPQYAEVPTKEAIPKARAAALRALELDDTLGEAHAVLAGGAEEANWRGAESDYKRAIELSPTYPTAHHWYANLLRGLGRFDEASREYQRAQELDPLSPVINVVQGWIPYYQGHYDQALAAYRAALELNPRFPEAHRFVGNVYLGKHMYREAIVEFQLVRASAGESANGLPGLGYAYAVSGSEAEARKVLDELMGFLQRGKQVEGGISLVYLGLGEKEKALDWLDKACDADPTTMLELKFDPLWQNLRSEPRFVALLKKSGLDK